MSIPAEWEAEDCWNEDDREFADGMSIVLEQAYNAKGVNHYSDALLARICVELGIIRTILSERLDSDKPEPWKDV